MLTRTLGKTGWDVAAVGLGCWNIGNQWGRLSDDEAAAIVRTAREHGTNLFDVAESYGEPNGTSELRLGRALEGIRDDVYLVSKIGNWGKRSGQGVPKTTPDMIRLCGHACAGRLRTDYIDVMLCHDGRIEDPSVYIEGFRRLCKEGFIRAYGISTNDLAVLERFHLQSDGECAVVEVDYSLLNRAPEEAFLPFCQEKNIGVLVRGPLARGVLAGRYDATTEFTDDVRQPWNAGGERRAQYEALLAGLARMREQLDPDQDLVTAALRYVLSHPVGPVAIPGATSPRQVIHNAQAGEAVLGEEQLAALRAL